MKETMTLTGASKTVYEFELYRVGTKFNPVAACYAFTKDANQAGNYPLVYIGETGDLSERFDNHHKAGCIQRAGATLIGVRVTRGKAEAERVEADVLGNYNPPCNE